MGLYPDKFNLPDNATVKEINAFKKRINWGEIPAFFHLVANSIAEAEGFINYGFDNAFKRITDRRNWNYDKLGVPDDVDLRKVDHVELIEPLAPPRICLYHVFSNVGYELLAFPYVNDSITDEYRRDDKNMEFKVWDPSQMKVLVRITQFHKFIAFTLKNGDDADTALVIHAHLVVNKIIDMLQQVMTVQEIKGMTIQQAFKLQNANPDLSPDEVIISTQLDKELAEAEAQSSDANEQSSAPETKSE